MSDILSLEVQREQKPKIEDVAHYYVEGERLKNVLDFVEWMRESKMNLRWASHNKWTTTTKNKILVCVCLGKPALGSNNGRFHIGCLDSFSTKFHEVFTSNEEIREYIWANVKECRKCGPCGPRKWEYAGKLFDNCCGLNFYNPDAGKIEHIKKIILARREYIKANKK